MARVLILGGAGSQGWQAAKTVLKRSTADDHIVILSRDHLRGSSAVLRLNEFSGSCKVTSSIADLSDPGTFATHLRKGDIVLNTAAPFFELGAIAAKISVECGAHYFDVCDDWEATIPILALHSKATAKQVAVVTGFGAAPGITSMLAMIAMRNLDDVEQLITAWPASGGGSSPLASNVPLVHFVQCCVGPIRLMREGKLVDEEPLKKERIALPHGAELFGYTIGSPESVTMPTRVKGIRTSLNLAMMRESAADQLRTLASAVREGSFSISDAASLLNQADGDEGDEPKDGSPQMFAVAIGIKDGVRVTVQTYLSAWPDQGYTIAGTALGLAPKLLTDGILSVSGAHSIEAVLSPETYLDALARAVLPDFQYQVETISSAI